VGIRGGRSEVLENTKILRNEKRRIFVPKYWDLFLSYFLVGWQKLAKKIPAALSYRSIRILSFCFHFVFRILNTTTLSPLFLLFYSCSFLSFSPSSFPFLFFSFFSSFEMEEQTSPRRGERGGSTIRDRDGNGIGGGGVGGEDEKPISPRKRQVTFASDVASPSSSQTSVCPLSPPLDSKELSRREQHLQGILL
jgi:hypothetical protein